MRRIISILLILTLMALLAVPSYQAFAQSDDDQEPLKVVTKEIEPFVFVVGEGVSGFSIDLWEALARETGLEF